MKRATIFALGVAAIASGAAAVAIYANWNTFVPIAAMGINYLRYLNAPAGTLMVETAPGFDGANPAAAARSPPPDDGLWPSYNKTLNSNRFSSLTEINRENAGRLKVLCTYDTHQYTGFNSGLLMVDGALLFATDHDTYSIDPITCGEKWHKHEVYAPATPQAVNRGVAFLDGRVFRGTQDGRVLAYDFKSGERLWETAIADPKKSESAPAAPIAWNDLVFIGNAGGDFKGVKGRMYALDAATGRIVWEFYLVPKQPEDPTRGPQGVSPLDASSWDVAGGSPISGGATWTSYTLDPTTGLLYVPGGNPAPDFAAAVRGGANLYTDSVVVLDARTGAYHAHFKLMPKDWHDWDVSSAPVLVTTASGKHVMLVAPKDGHLYGFDLDTKERLYRVPVTAVENADVPSPRKRACIFVPGRSAAPNGTDRPTTHKIISSWSARCNGARPSGSNPRARSRAWRNSLPGPRRIPSIPLTCGARPIPCSNGRAGSMRSTRIAVNGAGGPRPTIPCRAAWRRPRAASSSLATWAAIYTHSTRIRAANSGAKRSAARLAAASSPTPRRKVNVSPRRPVSPKSCGQPR